MKLITPKWIAFALSGLVTLSLLFVYQNCGEYKSATPTTNLSSQSGGIDYKTVLEGKCAQCHDGSFSFNGPNDILDEAYLVANAWIIPQNPATSPVYKALSTGMPKDLPALSNNEKQAIYNWIANTPKPPTSTPAILVANRNLAFNFGDVTVSSWVRKLVTVVNTGGKATTGIAATVSGSYKFVGGTFPGTGGTCNATLLAGDTCTIKLEFRPTAAGAASGLVEFTFSDVDGSHSAMLNLVGNGVVTPKALLSFVEAPGITFPDTALTQTSKQKISLINEGTAEATGLAVDPLSVPFQFAGGSYPGTNGTCGTTLAAGASCFLEIAFKPTIEGSFNKSLQASFNDGSESKTVSLSLLGKGGVALLKGAPTSHNFGSVTIGQSQEKEFVITNEGLIVASTIMVSPVPNFAFKGGSYPGIGGNCGASLVPSESCKIVPEFKPTTDSAASANLEFSYNDGVQNKVLSFALTGQGTAVSVPKANLTFVSDDGSDLYGDVSVGATKVKLFTLSNIGNANATSLVVNGPAGGVWSFAGGSYPGTGGNCASSLNPSASCKVAIAFTPGGAQAYTKLVAASYFDSVTTNNVSRTLSGSGVVVALANVLMQAVGGGTSFPPTTIGSQSEKIFRLKNSGAGPATQLAISGIDSPFSFKGAAYPGTGGTCATKLEPLESCDVVLVFSPTNIGSSSETFDYSYFSGVSSQSHSFTILGNGVAPNPDLKIDQFPPFIAKVGSDDSAVIKLKNIGLGEAQEIQLSSFDSGGSFTFRGGSYPGTGGNCLSTLAGGASCNLVVSFSAVGGYQRSGYLTLRFKNLSGQVLTKGYTFVGRGVDITQESTLGIFAVIPSSFTPGSTFRFPIRLANLGTNNLQIQKIYPFSGPYSYVGGSFPGTGGTCTMNPITPGQSCNLVIQHSGAAEPKALGAIFVVAEFKDLVSSQIHVAQFQGNSPTVLSTGCNFDDPHGFSQRYIFEGESVTFYKDAIVPTGSTCASQVRTCNGGVLSGNADFKHRVCWSGFRACEVDGRKLQSGETIDLFSRPYVNDGETCNSIPFTCSFSNPYQLNGPSESTKYRRCAVRKTGKCVADGALYNSGAQVQFYYKEQGYTLPNTNSLRCTLQPPSTCQADGKWKLWTNQIVDRPPGYRTCVEQGTLPLIAAEFAGLTKQSASPFEDVFFMTYGRSSASSALSCNESSREGRLSQATSFFRKHSNCKIQNSGGQNSCTFEADGWVVPHGATVRGFKFWSVRNLKCNDSSQLRTCNNGVLSGSSAYQYSQCTQSFDASGGNRSCLLNGVTVPHDQSRAFFRYSTAKSPEECYDLKFRRCIDGKFRSDFGYEATSCTVTP